MTRLAGLPLALLALALACGPAKEEAAKVKPPPLHACKLLPYDEADPGGVGGLLPASSEMDVSVGDDFARCMYSTVELPPKSISLELRRAESEKKAKGQQSATVDYLPRLSGVEPVNVPGVGDEAAWAGGKLDQLHVRFGALRLIVTVETGDESERQGRAVAFAKKALERLAAPPTAAPAAPAVPAAPAPQNPAPTPG